MGWSGPVQLSQTSPIPRSPDGDNKQREKKEIRRETNKDTVKQTKRRERDKKRDVRMKKCLLRASSARRGSGYWNCDHCGTHKQTNKKEKKQTTLYNDDNIYEGTEF